MNILTQDQARFRSEHIESHLKYHLNIELLKGDSYKGNILTQFRLKNTHPELFVDYQGQEIQQIQLNGNKVDLQNCQDNKIYLPHQNQKKDNTLQISFVNKYSKSGHGLHSFMDGNDQYVYSQCEPHHASKMFPCFDQPNLKGRFSLKAIAPNEWRVISNEEIISHQKLNEEYQEIQFDTTDPLSSYLYAILAGPYEQIVASPDSLHRGIPQSLYCRKSLYNYLQKDANHIFSLTSKSMDYFEKMFRVNYPFKKYDQIFCPEYSTGAMENVGAVMKNLLYYNKINDLYIFKEKVTKSAFAARDNTIVHELSHMWFGNLVTMDWWDDLWLNESFAEFIAHQCQADHGEDSWVQFFERKLWGYDTDEKITTHPIYAEVKDTDQAENIFDGITYAKGAALLKQIYYMQNKREFSQSMGEYFTKFAYSNATLKDFFNSMSKQSKIDWDKFKNEWIMTSGFNTVSAQVLDGKIIFKIEGSPQRQHNIKIGVLFDNRIEEHKILISSNSEVAMPNIKQDQAIILNYNDESYVKTSYTKQQLQKLLDNFHLVPGTLNKLVVFLAYFDQVNLGQICYKDFFDFAHKYIYNVKSEVEMKILLQWIVIGLERLTPKKFQQQMLDKLANQLEKLYNQEHQDTFLLVRAHYVRLCRNQERLKKLDIEQIGIKDGWQAVYNTFIYDKPDWDLFKRLESKDVDSKKHKRFLDSLLQRTQEQWAYFNNFNNEESVQMLSQAMRAFNHEHFDNSQYEDPYFNSLTKIFGNKNQEYAKAYFSCLYPKGERFSYYNQRLEEILKVTNNQFLIKLCKEAIDSNNRRSRAFSTY